MTRDDLVAFESDIRSEWESGNLPCLLHLSGGNEAQLLYLFASVKSATADSSGGEPGDWVFSTHRNHYHALLAGIPAEEVKEKIMRGRSMFVYSKEHNFFCSAVLAGTCAIAAGVAYAIKEEGRRKKEEVDSVSPRVWCFIGDGGEEQGHFYEAAMFVEANELPCTFIIEDNERSVDTPLSARRGNAQGLEHLFKCVWRYKYTPTYPHAGSGCSFQITFKPEAIDRMKRER